MTTSASAIDDHTPHTTIKMNNLLRELAPISDNGWTEIDDEARSTLATYLAGRKLVELTGPLGWTHSAVNLGRIREIGEHPDAGGAEETSPSSVRTSVREVLPLVELRVPFEVDRRELEAAARGAVSPDLDPARMAAQDLALAEDRMIFSGLGAAGVTGIKDGSEHVPVGLPVEGTAIPEAIADALQLLRGAGVNGPYAAALDPAAYNALATTAVGSHTALRFAERLLDGPVVWAPGIDDGVVLSLRGDDFELVVGRDASIGYTAHDRDTVALYLEESVTFRLHSPEAAVSLERDAGSAES